MIRETLKTRGPDKSISPTLANVRPTFKLKLPYYATMKDIYGGLRLRLGGFARKINYV